MRQNEGKFCLAGDHASWHKSKECGRAYRQPVIFFIYTPPDTPELNPVEHVFSMLKNSYKRARFLLVIRERSVSIFKKIRPRKERNAIEKKEKQLGTIGQYFLQLGARTSSATGENQLTNFTRAMKGFMKKSKKCKNGERKYETIKRKSA